MLYNAFNMNSPTTSTNTIDSKSIDMHYNDINDSIQSIVQHKYDTFFSDVCEEKLEDVELHDYDKTFEYFQLNNYGRSFKKLTEIEIIKQIVQFLDRLNDMSSFNIQVYHSFLNTIVFNMTNEIIMYTNTNLKIRLQPVAKEKEKSLVQFYTDDKSIDFIMGFNPSISNFLCEIRDNKCYAFKSLDKYALVFDAHILQIIDPHCYVDYLMTSNNQMINHILNTDYSELKESNDVATRKLSTHAIYTEQLILELDEKDKLIEIASNTVSRLQYGVFFDVLLFITVVSIVIVHPDILINGIVFLHEFINSNIYHGEL